jgi:CBS domain-containing protein
MNSAPTPAVVPPLVLAEKRAAELMTPSPVSIRESATVREAIELLTRREISGAPVIDAAGRPVGVVSRGDILVHDREAVDYVGPADDDESDATRVRDIMTPVVFAVSPDAPASRVVREMIELKVHRLFVVDDLGVLVGVITVLDVLRHLAVNQPSQRMP